MPIRFCKYNPKKDKKVVQPGAAIDLKNAFINNTVPVLDSSHELAGNGITEPDAVMNGADDVFDLYRQGYSVRHYEPEEELKE